MFENIVIGKPLVPAWCLLGKDEEDFEKNERDITLFTEEHFLPKLMVMSGIVKSVSEVRRNQPQLIRTLDKLDFLEIKWGKKRLFILVGE